MLERLLKKENYKTEIAHDGYEVLEKLKQKDFDLLLLDIQMPNMDGVECAKKIRENKKDLYIIALTGYSSEEDKENFLKAGINDILVKPIMKDELDEKIKSIKI